MNCYMQTDLDEELNLLILNDNGNKFYYKDNLLHREDGPTIEYVNGDR